MIKIIKHFIEALFVYFSFVIAKLIGLKLSRILFSFIFRMVGPIIRSNNIVEKNLNIFSSEVSDFKKKEIISKKLNQILEDMILKNPYQWIWTHDRWK